MKSNALAMSAFVLALAASSGAFAATQGTAGATSTGTYTNTLGTTAPPQVRVFGLVDAMLTSTSGSVPTPWGPQPGVNNQFCVAHSAGGNVRLTFSSAGITAGSSISLVATSATTGATRRYHHIVYPSSGTPVSGLTSAAATVDISNAQNDMVNCVNPNVTKTIILTGGSTWAATETDVFTDVVTVTASPI